MTTDAHNAVVQAVISTLLATPALASGNIYRGRRRAISKNVELGIAVRFGASDPSRGAIKGAPIDWTTTVLVECYARTTGTESADEAALALHADAYARLNTDPSLGGVVDDLLPPSLDVSEEDRDEQLGCVIAGYQLRHRTAENTLQA